MKKGITIIMVLLLVTACKNENNPLTKMKEAASTVKEAKQGFDNVNEALKGFEGIEENTIKLAALTPITKDQIKAWMPDEVGGLKRTAFTIGNQLGISTFKLTFKGDDGKKINISISDGAGNGAAIVSMFMMMQNMEMDQEDEKGYERTQTFDGQRTLIKYRSAENYEKATLQCLKDQRFGIEANGWKMTPDELWGYIKELEIEKIATH